MGADQVPPTSVPAAPAGSELGPPRLLSYLRSEQAMSLVEHRGHFAPPPRSRDAPDPSLTDLIERAGLRGRGGAGFPTARKWQAVAAGPGPRIVVANGTEGEPASGKDRLVMGRLPHLVLDGAAFAAAAVGAEQVVVCVDRSDATAFGALRHAVVERQSAGGIPMRVAGTPPRYVAGEETGLVHWLNGGPAMPTEVPPRPFQRGVHGRPTLVQNVETLAHVTMIAALGPEWFREIGPPEEPGSVLVSVSGTLDSPMVLEAAVGTRTGALLEAAGPVTAPLQAVLFGGFFGTWAPAGPSLAAPFSRSGLAPLGASPGAGVIIAFPQGCCGLAETARILSWYAAESAGQCGPCLYGLADLARGAVDLAVGQAGRAEVERLSRWANEIEGRGACKHPDGAVRLLRSALSTFAGDVAGHISGKPCAGSVGGGRRISVPVPPQIWR